MVKRKAAEKESTKDENHEERGLGDIFRRVTSLGLGAAFLTEDTIKSVINDLPLPKDITSALIQNAKGAKGELLSSLGKEFKEHLSKIDTKDIVDHIAKNYDLEVTTKISFSPKNKKESGK